MTYGLSINGKVVGICTSIDCVKKDNIYKLQIYDYKSYEESDILIQIIKSINDRLSELKAEIKAEAAKEEGKKDYSKILILQARKNELEKILN